MSRGPGTTAASLLCDTAPVRIRAVVFDLFITLTDWEAERCRPEFMNELAAALGADPLAFSSLMRETFTERVAGDLGDARSTFSTLAARLGCDLRPENLDRVMALRTTSTDGLSRPERGSWRQSATSAPPDMRSAS